MINKVILIGNVGADPEIRTLESGVKMARIRVATTERIYNREAQESRDHTEWHSVVLWRNLADVADRFIRKGSQVYIEGRLRSREWTDQQGVKRYSIEILADDLKMLGRRSDNPSAGQPSPRREDSRGTAVSRRSRPMAADTARVATRPIREAGISRSSQHRRRLLRR